MEGSRGHLAAVPRGTPRVPPAPTAMRARGTGSALHAGSPTSRQAPQKNDLLARSMGRSLPAALDCAGGWEGRRMWWPHLRAGRVRGSLRFSKQSKTEGASSQPTATASSGRARTHAGALHLGGAPASAAAQGTHRQGWHSPAAGGEPVSAATRPCERPSRPGARHALPHDACGPATLGLEVP